MGILKVENLSFAYKEPILDKINFDVGRGEFISLLGINGAGKSTLLKNLNRLLKAQSGTIYIDGKELSSYSNMELARKMSYVSQYNKASSNTVYDTIFLGRLPHMRSKPRPRDYEIVDNIIAEMELEKYCLRNTTNLSGGEYQKVVLARALAQEPDVILLDEPTSNLDIKNQIDVMDFARKFCEDKGIAIIVSIHDINLALQYSDKFLLIKEGKVFAYGDLEVINEENIYSVYGINVDIINHKGKKILITS